MVVMVAALHEHFSWATFVTENKTQNNGVCTHDFKHAFENARASNFLTVHIKMRVQTVSW